MSVRRFLPALVVALTLGVGIVVGTLVSHGVHAARPGAGGPAPGARPLSAPSPVSLSNSFAQIADKVGPTVVNIKTESTVRISRRGMGGPQGTPFDGFFDRFFRPAPGERPPSMLPESTLGSGVILDKAGYILTNYHVVMREGEDRPVDQMRVFLEHDDATSRGYPAHIVGKDKWTDLAVIKVDAGRPLPAATLGDSDAMRVGDWVLAIGSPFGLNSTVTAGIISAKGRGIEPGWPGEFKRFLQTDAAINPGNSGGPLVNLAGQVIGINTAIATSRDAYDGVGFAIPSDTARRVYNSIISTGGVRRGAIGVTFVQGRNQTVLESFGTDHGVVVDSVKPGSPADRAGLQRGDVITGVDSRTITDGDDLLNLISNSAPGTRLKMQYLRDGRLATAEIVVGDWAAIVGEEAAAAARPSPADAAEGSGALGATVRNLTADQSRALSQQLHLGSPRGVVVSEVVPGGFSDVLGLVRGDVILSVNRKTVTSVDDLTRLQAKLKHGQNVLLLIARQNEGGYTTLFLADRLP